MSEIKELNLENFDCIVLEDNVEGTEHLAVNKNLDEREKENIIYIFKSIGSEELNTIHLDIDTLEKTKSQL
ncbi:MAG: hypothetical protein ACOCXL_00300 [Halanaerobium sp.]